MKKKSDTAVNNQEADSRQTDTAQRPLIADDGALDRIEPQLGMSQEHDDACFDDPITGLVYVPTLPTELATTVARLVGEYHNLDAEINNLTTDALTQGAKLDKAAAKLEKTKDELFILLTQMQSILSQRGDLHRRLKSDELPSDITEQLLAQLDALPGWVQWYEGYRGHVKDAKSLRTVQRQIAELNRMSLSEHTEGNEEDEDGEDGTEDDLGQQTNGMEEPGRVDIKTTQELLTEFAGKMLDVLVGQSLNSESVRITRAVGLVKDLLRAIDEGKLIESMPCDADIHEDPQPPSSIGASRTLGSPDVQ